MQVFNLYSRRKRKAQGEPDVYQYDTIPENLRVQIGHIWDDAIGPFIEGHGDRHHHGYNHEAWSFLRDTICREHGKRFLSGHERTAKKDCMAYLLSEDNPDLLLDLIELSCLYLERRAAKFDHYERAKYGITQSAEDAIEELNYRFREAAVGYQFEHGQIIRVDSQVVHREVVQPALSLLSDARFRGAQQEYLAAHAHYRAGEYKDCITDTLNAFESTLKSICEIKKWDHPKGARATDLIKIIRKNGLLPDYLDSSFDQLIATLQSGLPKVRNEAGGHGQGPKPKEVPDYVAAYALHLAAAKIVLLAQALKASE